jgi:hypothetical protein
LSKDTDRNEYSVWKAMVAISPRVIVIEYNVSLDPEESFTIEYRPFFNEMKKHRSGLYHGAGFSKNASARWSSNPRGRNSAVREP